MDDTIVEGPPQGPRSTARPRPVREDRAARAFGLLAIITLVFLVAGLAGGGDQSQVERLVRLAPGLVGLIAFLVAAGALNIRRPWATASLSAVLVVLILGGVVSVIAALREGRLLFPFGLLLSIWALRARTAATVMPRFGPGALALTGAFVLASVGPWLADAALTTGGPLIVDRSDLVPTLRVECGPPGDGVPATLTATYEWSWRRTEALADSTDGVAVGWTGADEAGTDLFVIGDVLSATNRSGIWSGSGSPSAALADQFARRYGAFSGWTWGIDLSEQRMQAGRIVFTMLRVSGEPVPHGIVTIQAAYVHLGRWINEDAMATCAW